MPSHSVELQPELQPGTLRTLLLLYAYRHSVGAFGWEVVGSVAGVVACIDLNRSQRARHISARQRAAVWD